MYTSNALRKALVGKQANIFAAPRLWLSGSALPGDPGARPDLSVPWIHGKSLYRRLLRAAQQYPSVKRDGIFQDIRSDFRVRGSAASPYFFRDGYAGTFSFLAKEKKSLRHRVYVCVGRITEMCGTRNFFCGIEARLCQGSSGSNSFVKWRPIEATIGRWEAWLEKRHNCSKLLVQHAIFSTKLTW